MLQPMTPTRLRQTQLDGSMEMNLLSFLWSVSYTDPISESDAFFHSMINQQGADSLNRFVYMFFLWMYVYLNRTVSGRNEIDESLSNRTSCFNILNYF